VRKPATNIAIVVGALLLLAAPVFGQAGSNKKAEKELLDRAGAFAAAFAQGDAKALAGFWAPDGDYVDHTGRHLKGRAAIAKAFQSLFAEHKRLKLRIEVHSMKFLAPNVAIEDGVSGVMGPDGGPPTQTRYTIVHVKKDGEWYLQSVREAPFVADTNYKHFRSLEWLIGEWADENKGEVAHVAFAWGPNQNFVVSTFTTTLKGIPVASGTQWIAWDPVAKGFRSWTFDASGAFGEASWKATSRGQWAIKSKMTLPGGKASMATNLLTRVDADTLTFQSTDRTLNGDAVPDSKAFTLKRVKESQSNK
jgi:uncharacterized protein (TIGR02246 family)